MRAGLLIFVAGLGMISGCHRRKPYDERDGKANIVAEVGSSVVSAGDVDLIGKSMSAETRRRYETPEGRQDLVNMAVERRLLAEEARTRRLDRDPEFVREMDEKLAEQLLRIEVARRFTDEEALRLYEQNKSKFTSQRVHLRQILIRIKADGGADAEAKARNRAGELLGSLHRGAKFEDVARKYSEDSISASAGGDLGQVSPGKLPEEIASAVERLSPGKYSDVVQTPFGFHIVQLVENAEVTVRPLTDVRPVLELMFRDQVRHELIEELRRKYRVSLTERSGE